MTDVTTKPLFPINGIAVVIDDEIDESNANINDLIRQIESKNIPCVKYKELPDSEIIDHLQGVSIIILDWKLNPLALKDTIGQVMLPDSFEDDNVLFLKKLSEKKVFVPIFIFTNGDLNSIRTKLIEKEIYDDNRPNFIFIELKSKLADNKLFDKISSWIYDNPPVYVLKTWENEYLKAQGSMFSDFYKHSPSWVTILTESFEKDSTDISAEMMTLIQNNLFSRMKTKILDESLLKITNGETDKEHIRQILEDCRFLKKEYLSDDEFRCGDVFLGTKKRLFINIRPDCDCVARGCTSPDSIELYLVEGTINKDDYIDTNLEDLSEEKRRAKELQNENLMKLGNFVEKANEVIIFSMYEGKTYTFYLKKFTIKTVGDLKDKRIGRLLPPFSNHIQARYAYYLQRQGLPRIPLESVQKIE
jgi:hypothetical protein